MKKFYSVFFDSQILKFEIQYSDHFDQSIKITTKKNQKTSCVIFTSPSNLEIHETEFHKYYIGDCKCVILQNDEYYISLDPYNGNEEKIDDKDNFKFYCKSIILQDG